jgi:hypothetical protein
MCYIKGRGQEHFALGSGGSAAQSAFEFPRGDQQGRSCLDLCAAEFVHEGRVEKYRRGGIGMGNYRVRLTEGGCALGKYPEARGICRRREHACRYEADADQQGEWSVHSQLIAWNRNAVKSFSPGCDPNHLAIVIVIIAKRNVLLLKLFVA